MGCSPKVGLDYIRLDCHLDKKFQLIEAEFGLVGFAVVVKLLQLIYGEQGYYCEWDEEVALVFSRAVTLGANAVSEIVNASIKRELFDRRLFEKYHILTSHGIQKWYFGSVERRKKVDVIREYLLLPDGDLPKNVNIIRISASINPENADRNRQSRVEQSESERESESTGRAAAIMNPYGDHDGPPLDLDTLEVYASSNLQYLSPTNMDELVSFLDTLPEDLIRHAIDQACGAGVRKYNYVRTILNRYVDQGIKTVGDAVAEESRKKGGKNANHRISAGREVQRVGKETIL